MAERVGKGEHVNIPIGRREMQDARGSYSVMPDGPPVVLPFRTTAQTHAAYVLDLERRSQEHTAAEATKDLTCLPPAMCDFCTKIRNTLSECGDETTWRELSALHRDHVDSVHAERKAYYLLRELSPALPQQFASFAIDKGGESDIPLPSFVYIQSDNTCKENKAKFPPPDEWAAVIDGNHRVEALRNMTPEVRGHMVRGHVVPGAHNVHE